MSTYYDHEPELQQVEVEPEVDYSDVNDYVKATINDIEAFLDEMKEKDQCWN